MGWVDGAVLHCISNQIATNGTRTLPFLVDPCPAVRMPNATAAADAAVDAAAAATNTDATNAQPSNATAGRSARVPRIAVVARRSRSADAATKATTTNATTTTTNTATRARTDLALGRSSRRRVEINVRLEREYLGRAGRLEHRTYQRGASQ